MIKYLILFIHLIGFSFFQWLNNDIAVQQNLPGSMTPGSEVQVDITINKNGVGGFAKFQQSLPQGFSAEVVEAKGATFSFKDNVMKFIWMALPAEEQFVISYKLVAGNDLKGDYNFGGKFSYIADNERKNIEVPASTVTVSEEALAVVEEPVVENTEEEIVEEESTDVVEEPENEEEVETETMAEVEEEEPGLKSVEISSERAIEINGDYYVVTASISQKNLEGFAKIVDQLPAGFTAEAIETAGGVFTFKNNEAKILWMAAPTSESFSVSYKLIPDGATLADYDINGIFSYLQNDITQQHIMNSTAFSHTIAPATEESVEEEIAEETSEEEVIEEPVVEESVVEEPIDEEPVAEEETVEEPVTNNEVVNVPAAETGIAYKVQVGAGHQKVSSNYFKSKFNLTESVSTEAHEGWIKYVVGKYQLYKEARDKRNEIRANVSRAFVTAYNEGKRITVQEALMISNQKWYK